MSTPYLFETSTFLLVFYICYRWWVAPAGHFVVNRFFLFTAVVLAHVLPWVNFSVNHPIAEWSATVTSLPLSVEPATSVEWIQTTAPTWSWTMLLPVIYWLGVAVMGLRLLVNLGWLTFQIRKYSTSQKDGFAWVLLPGEVAPFSFFHWLFVGKHQAELPQMVLAHEMVHRQRRHSVDILICEFLLVFFWFQPLLYLFRKEIIKNHEYEADEAVLAGHAQPTAYWHTLLAYTSIRRPSALSSAFSFVSIQNRIKMNNHRKSSLGRLGALLLLTTCLSAALLTLLALKPALPSETRPSFTVLLDAGHGGNDPGMRTSSGRYEKDITLQLAQQVTALLQHESHIQISLTRAADVFVPLQTRPQQSQALDLFVSLHIGEAEVEPGAWSDVAYASEQTSRPDLVMESRGMAYLFAHELASAQRKLTVSQRGYMVLKMAQCPAVLLTMTDPGSTETELNATAERLAAAIRLAANETK